MNVDDLGADAVSLQHLCRLQALIHFQAGGDNGHIAAFPQNDALADLKFIFRTVVDNRNRQTSESQVHRSLHLIGRLHCRFRLHIVGGIDDGHARDDTHQRDILVALMAGSILAHGNAGVGRSDLHIQMGISHRITHLLERSARREHGEAGAEGNLACGGESRRDADHIGLGNTAVNVALREHLLEHSRLGSFSQIGVQNHQVVVLFSKFYQSVAVTLSGCNLLYF